ncbi:MAG: hypothetical protein K2X62_07735 [Beijerinckiaceae bacterium]|nr:hypothetical protein [Beijerinckiaceae bacterium]MDO9439457.1 hypothetical protein [Beijerinckiaceae bacterium]
MLTKLIALTLVAGSLAACSSRTDSRASLGPQVAEAPRAAAAAPQNYVWARNDGQRMSGNPQLMAKGQADKTRCEGGATTAAGFDMQAFIRCMEASGYSRRDA